MASTSQRRPVFSTAAGTRVEAFGPGEWALLSGVALIWGSAFFLIEIALEAFRPGLITAGRVGLGFLTLSAFPRARRAVDRGDWPRIVVLGMTWVAIPFTLFPIAQQHIDSALTGMLNALMPIFAALFAAAFLRAMPRPVHLVGIALGFGGAIAISFPALGSSSSSAYGVGLIAAATVFYGLSINLAVPLQQRYGALPVMARALGVATIATLPFGLASLDGSAWDVWAVVSVGTLGMFGTGFAFVMMAGLAGRVGATRGGVAIYFIPIVSIALGVAFLDETVQVIQLLGTAVVLLGAWLTSRREHVRGASPHRGEGGT